MCPYNERAGATLNGDMTQKRYPSKGRCKRSKISEGFTRLSWASGIQHVHHQLVAKTWIVG